jgi:hypothetical protein
MRHCCLSGSKAAWPSYLASWQRAAKREQETKRSAHSKKAVSSGPPVIGWTRSGSQGFQLTPLAPTWDLSRPEITAFKTVMLALCWSRRRVRLNKGPIVKRFLCRCGIPHLLRSAPAIAFEPEPTEGLHGPTRRGGRLPRGHGRDRGPRSSANELSTRSIGSHKLHIPGPEFFRRAGLQISAQHISALPQFAPNLAICFNRPLETNTRGRVAQCHVIRIVHLRMAGLNAPPNAAPFCGDLSDGPSRCFSPDASGHPPCEQKSDCGWPSLFACGLSCGTG